ncbi:MAG: hypothetical protein OXP36_11435, partial [Gammaproteobacteria bacterium]|nr:hypothetical protein [Gammaproteobacteria bacterium]
MTDFPLEGELARADDLNFRRVVHIFVRTWPFIRPAAKHLLIFVAVSAAIAVFSAVLVFIITGLMNGGIVAGRPLGQLHVAIYDLDPAVYVNVETLSADARLALCWPVILSTIPLMVVAVGGALILLYYGIWIFQGINQRMRV